MVLIVLLFQLKAVRSSAASDPFVFGLWFLGGAVALKVGAFAIFHHGHLQNMTPDAVLPLIACGWLLCFAKTPARKMVAVAAALGFATIHVSAPALGGWDYAVVGQYRLPWLLAAVAALLYVPRVPLPPVVAKVVTWVSGASFTIYLVHVLPVHVMRYELRLENAPLIVLAALGMGILVHRLQPGRVIAGWLARLRVRDAVVVAD
jgi:surface polysaccharide O-acyltransferase-like enzyme